MRAVYLLGFLSRTISTTYKGSLSMLVGLLVRSFGRLLVPEEF